MAEQATDRPLDFTARLVEEESRLLPERQAYRQYFSDAYAAYPSIPAGALEAIAYAQSRWVHLEPDRGTGKGSHQHMPEAYGVMGLYAGGGARDQISQASAITGMKVEKIKRDPKSNILAAAALLDLELREDVERLDLLRGGMILQPAVEDIVPALKRYAGFSEYPAANLAQEYARISFAYDVLLALDRGVDDRGIRVPEKAIAWERGFTPQQLTTLRAPFVRLRVTEDVLESREYHLDPITETLQHKRPAFETLEPKSPDSGEQGTQDIESIEAQSLLGIQSTDYGPALWVASPYYHSRSSYDSTTIHTAQGSYAGTISWFQSNPYSVSAHYVIRSSDGQITQMVRNHHAAHHVGVHNGTTLGIEHEGYVDNSSWYTTAMYNSSAALVRSFCDSYASIDCANAYDGPAHSGVVVLPASIDVKGHQHYTSQTHTDPGINWNWGHYYTLLNPGSGGGSTTVLDTFESSEGHFYTSPTYSGSTVGISTQSLATRDCNASHQGSCSLRILLKDDTGSSSDWQVRLLSGAGSPSANVSLSGNGRIGYWIYAAGSGMRAAIGIDDSDGTERGYSKSLTANSWTFVEWDLADSDDWYAWAGGANGIIDAGTVTLDAVWILRDPDTAYDVNLYLDDVQIQN